MKKLPFEQNDLKDLTKEQIEGYKKEYQDIYLITVEDKKCFLHKPTRQTLDLALSSREKKRSLYGETILKNSWLAGNKEIIDDDAYFYAASSQLDELITFKDAELKKL
jgi:hypothetical protein